MKTTQRFLPPIAAVSSVRRLWPVFVAVIVSPAFAAEPGPGAAEPKTHTLFMGADLSIEQNKQLYRVQNVVGSSFVIQVDGRDVKIPAGSDAVKLKVDRSLKLTATSVAVGHLKAERAYTPGSDPWKKYMASQGGAIASQDVIAATGATTVLAQRMATANAIANPAGGGPVGFAFGGPNLQVAQLQQNNAFAASMSDFGNNGAMVGKLQDDLREELFDAMDVQFDVSSEKLIRQPYVVVMAQYRTRDAKAGGSLNWIYAAALAPLDSKPQKFRIRKGGFPPGFELEKCQVHIYDGGQELASNVAEKQVPLTRDEAFQYVLFDYVSSHKGATLPATPAMGVLPGDWPARVAGGQFKQTYYVSVTKDGKPAGIFADKSCSQKVDDSYLDAAVQNIRFKPALDKGKAVDGVASVKFAELSI